MQLFFLKQQLQYNSLIPKFIILAPQVTEFLNSGSLIRTAGTPHCHLKIRCVTSPESLSPPQRGTTINARAVLAPAMHLLLPCICSCHMHLNGLQQCG
jgi:hypothetical protein